MKTGQEQFTFEVITNYTIGINPVT